MDYGVGGFWLFCASIRPPSRWQLNQLKERFSAERATSIADPSAFARELGAALAAQEPGPDVELTLFDELFNSMQPSDLGNRMVRVRHGPVCYCDDPKELVESFPDEHRAAVVPFIKRRAYAWQQEYRFSLDIRGEATENEWFLLISSGLRRLAQLEA
ncbi:MAG: hypothetical protein OXD50_04445 [Chloroflexi bacterium]|nr:hypothetical protein [Chloroflexota bacterium]